MNKRRPIENDELDEYIREDLAACTPEQRTFFEQVRLPLRKASIERFGKVEHVFIVASLGDEAMYFDDVEEEFGIAPINADGGLLEDGGIYGGLTYALWQWMNQPK